MFSRFIIFSGILILGLFASCARPKEFPGAYKGDQLHFGQGGGFSGVVNYFVLLKDGRLYHKDFRDSTYSQVDTWPENFTNQMFANYRTFHLDTITHYEPGDLYYFIQYHSENKPVHRIAWGKPGFRPDEKTVTYYNLLYKSTKSKS